MEVKEFFLSELIPYEKNPRRNDNAVDAVAQSIKKFGFKVPIVIDCNNVIVCGHARYKAAQKLRIEKVPCVVADDLTPEQIKAFRLVDNKTAELAEWDMAKLSTELKDLAGELMNELSMIFPFSGSDTTNTKIPASVREDNNYESIKFKFAAAQKELIEAAMKSVGDEFKETFGNPNKKGNALYEIVTQWAESRSK